MATKSAAKRLRQSEKRQLRNKGVKSELKTYRKKVLAAVEANNKEEAQAQLTKAVSLYDNAVQKGIVKLNTAARNKSRLAGKVNKIL